MTEIQTIFTAILAVCLLLDLLTVAARAGLLSSNLVRVLAQRENNEAQANRVLALIHSPRRLQQSLDLTQTLLRFASAGLLLGLFPLQDWTAWSILSAGGLLLLAALLLFWLEWAVEGLVSRNPEAWALRLAPFARASMVILFPRSAFSTNHRAGDVQEPVSAVTQDELKSMVDAGHQDGVLEQEERKMIYSIFQLGDTLAREIMVPRIYLTALDVNIPLAEAVDAFLQSGYSRVPIYEESVDKILGLVYAKDLLRAWREGHEDVSLRSMLRPAYFVPEAKKVDELLAELQAQRVHMAIVVDEYGGIAGLVTLEDIVEEIVGEILDEYDQSEELPYQQVGEGEYIFLGRIDLDDFNELMESQLPVDEAETLSGFIYSRVGRVPLSGESVRADDLLLTVEQVSGRRIRKVRAQRITAQDTQGEDSN